MPSWSAADLMCACISRAVRNGDVLLEGIGAFLPTAGYEMARLLHAPDAVGVSPVGSVVRVRGLPLSLQPYEASTVSAGLGRFTYGDMAMRYLPSYLSRDRQAWREFMRPAQVDRWGNTNNVVIGDYRRPTVRLPGGVGLPDGTVLEHEIFMYVPRHDARTFVADVDFVSTLGHRGARGGPTVGRRGNPTLLVSNLGTFRFDPDEGLTCTAVHPGVTREDLRAATGFPLAMADELAETPPPTREEQQALEEVDPLSLRRLEMLSGRDRRGLLRELLANPGAAVPSESAG